MANDLYVLLGVSANASQEAIHSAYQERAEKLLPGRSSSEAEPFKAVQEAYKVLGNPARRGAYNRQQQSEARELAESSSARRPAGSVERLRPREVSLRESFETYHPTFEELFERLWSNFDLLTRPKAEHIESLTMEIPLSSEEAATGGRVRILIPSRATCPTCGGHGVLGPYECWQCQGHGAITADYPLEVTYPAGILNQHAVQIPLSRFGIENFYLVVRFRVTDNP